MWCVQALWGSARSPLRARVARQKGGGESSAAVSGCARVGTTELDSHRLVSIEREEKEKSDSISERKSKGIREGVLNR
jgi:hypothetical protein